MTLVKFETAELAKEKGFKLRGEYLYTLKGKLVDKFYSNDYSEIYNAPTQSELQKWLRDNYVIDLHPYRYHKSTSPHIFVWRGSIYQMDTHETYPYTQLRLTKDMVQGRVPLEYSSFEETLEQLLFEALKLIKV